MDKMEIIFTVSVFVILAFQGTFIFRDAMKNKISYAWLWGIIGLLNFPFSAIVYLIYKKNIKKN